MTGRHDPFGTRWWTSLEPHDVGLDDPPPPRCPVVTFAKATVHLGVDPVGGVAVGMLAPDEVSAALRAEPAPPEPIDVQWAVAHPAAHSCGLVSCRVRADGHHRVHRFELLIPATDNVVAMFAAADAEAVVVSGNSHLDARTAASGSGEVDDVLLVVPIDHEFWAALLEVRTGVRFAGTTP